MPTYEYLIRYVDGLWQIRRGGHLVGAKQHKMDALQLAKALVRNGADRGEQSKILVADIKGSTIEFPMGQAGLAAAPTKSPAGDGGAKAFGSLTNAGPWGEPC
jgi:hypothetical protein